MIESPLSSLHRTVWLALLAALIAAGAFIYVPVGPVPMTLQIYFVLLAGLILGPVYGGLAVLLYILAGAVGLPVFSGGRAGFAHLLGPTGGFLLGFVLSAIICGVAGAGRNLPIPVLLLCVLAALGVTYVLGTLRLASMLDMEMSAAASAAVAPFIAGDLVKAVAAAVSYRFLLARRLLPQ
ncbi:biotin transporter BioY [Oleidesulfovibrio sp.]|uniref:biotin transporter BioY n=1 Tax=Oleidesulfovibrio sp. TaxID=2909707 RepID=UPI003A88FC71